MRLLDNWRDEAFCLTSLLLKKFHGNDVFNYWLWNMTPYPMGAASWLQIAIGFLFAFGIITTLQNELGDCMINPNHIWDNTWSDETRRRKELEMLG